MRAGKLRRDACIISASERDWKKSKSLMTLLIQTDKFGTSIGQRCVSIPIQ